MTRKRAFISFDFDNDADLRGNLIAQAKRPESPFSVVDCSLREPYDERWRQRVRGIIRKADLIIVICGKHTDKAKGVAAELSITREEGKRYFLLRGRRGRPCTKPAGALRTDEMHVWKWRNLHNLIHAR